MDADRRPRGATAGGFLLVVGASSAFAQGWPPPPADRTEHRPEDAGPDHRLNTLSAEIRRGILAEQLAAARGTAVHYLEPASVAWMYQVADHVIYSSRSNDPTAARSTVVA